MKQELSKAKKTLRERDREIAKLKSEVQNQKKVALENNSFTTKDAGPKTTDGDDKKESKDQPAAGQQAQA
jgi:hypothetical protein